MEPEKPGSGIVSRFILLTDIVSSSRLHEEYALEFDAALDKHNALIESTVPRHSGVIFKNTGDGYYAFFNKAHQCISCAAELARELAEFPSLSKDDPFQVRIVAHHGELRAVGDDFFGPALNRASRLCQVCHPEQVILSRAAKPAPRYWPKDVTITSLGEHYLRDLAEPEHLYQLNVPGLPQRFPSLPTLEYRPNNLWKQPSAFIGRQQELTQLQDMLMSGQQLVSIVGLGGYGKSRMAAQLLANLLPNFERGAFIIELAPVSAVADIVYAAARALKFKFYDQREPEEQLIDYLREKEMLLCFDNFEHVIEGRQLISGILRGAPQVKIVVTSREKLQIQGEQVFRLEPLQTAMRAGSSDSHRLFAERTSLVNSSFQLTAENTQQVGEICRKLSGIPLAIELAAAWMDSFTLEELNAQLAEQLELEGRYKDVPKRHRSLRASLDWSWDLLDTEQRETLMRMSTFKGGACVEAAAAVLGLGGMKLRKSLAALLDKSWLYVREVISRKETAGTRDGSNLQQQDANTMRWHMGDAACREYAFEKLCAAELKVMSDAFPQGTSLYETSVMAHASYFSSLVAREGPRLRGRGQLAACMSIELELENILEAIDTLLQRLRPANKAQAISASNRGARSLTAEQTLYSSLMEPIVRWLWCYYLIRGGFKGLHRLYKHISSMLPSQASAELRGWTAAGLCDACWREGMLEEVKKQNSIALKLATANGIDELQAWSLLRAGALSHRQGHFAKARELTEQSLQVYRKLGDRWGEAGCLNNLGIWQKSLGKYGDARNLYRESLAINRKLGDRLGEARSLQSLGILLKNEKHDDDARVLYEQALERYRELGDRWGEAGILNDLGILHSNQGDCAEARRLCEQSLLVYRELGDRQGEGIVLDSFASLLLAAGEVSAAREMLEQCEQVATELDMKESLACLHAKWSKYWLLEFEQKPVETTAAAGADAASQRAPREAIERALRHLTEAKEYAHDIGANWQSESGQEIAEARRMIIAFADKHGLSDQAVVRRVKQKAQSFEKTNILSD